MAIIVILCGAPHLYKKDMNNSGLYKELDALQLYLNRSEANLFKTNIGVKYEFNEGARRLRNSEYENVLKYIENK